MAEEAAADPDEATVTELQQQAEAAYLAARRAVFDLTDGPVSLAALNAAQYGTLIRLEAAQQALRDFQRSRDRRRRPRGASAAAADRRNGRHRPG